MIFLEEIVDQGFTVNPWWKMWVQPRKTIRAVVDDNNRYGFIGLCFLYGLAQGSHFAQAFSFSAYLSLWMIVSLIILLAIPVGAISFSLGSLILYWTGKLVRGQGTYHDIRAAVSWSNVTAIFSVIFVGLMVLSFGEAFFYRNFAESVFQDWRSLLLISFLVAELTLAVWKLVIFILALSEVQRVSVWMAILNLLLVGIVYFIVFFLIDKLLALVSRNNIGLI